MEYEKLTEEIISVFYEVYHLLGYGFLEKIYVNAMCAEMRRRGIKFVNQFSISVIFKGEVMGDYVADFVVDGKVVVEIKAIRVLSEADERQLLNYLRCTDKEVGLLLNFGEKAGIKRKVYDNGLKKKYC